MSTNKKMNEELKNKLEDSEKKVLNLKGPDSVYELFMFWIILTLINVVLIFFSAEEGSTLAYNLSSILQFFVPIGLNHIMYGLTLNPTGFIIAIILIISVVLHGGKVLYDLKLNKFKNILMTLLIFFSLTVITDYLILGKPAILFLLEHGFGFKLF